MVTPHKRTTTYSQHFDLKSGEIKRFDNKVGHNFMRIEKPTANPETLYNFDKNSRSPSRKILPHIYSNRSMLSSIAGSTSRGPLNFTVMNPQVSRKYGSPRAYMNHE